MDRDIRATALILAVAVLTAACSGTTDAGSSESTTSVPTTEATQADPVQGGTGSTTALPAPPEPSQPEDGLAGRLRRARSNSYTHLVGDLESEWGVGPLLLPPGSWTTGQLGTALTLELTSPWIMTEESPDHLSLIPPNPADGPQSIVFIMRPHWVIGPDVSGDPTAIEQMLGAAESTSGGFKNWVQANPSLDVIRADPSEVGGRSATRYEIKVNTPTGPSFGCLEGRACVAAWIPTAANGWRETTPLVFVADTPQVVWEVDLPETNLIIFGREQADAPGFINQVDALVAGLELGPATPPQLAPNDYGALTWPWVASQGHGEPIRFLNLGPEFVIDPGKLWFYGQEGWLIFSTEPDGIDTCPQANVIVARARYRSTSTESEPAEAYTSVDNLAQALLDNDRVGAVELEADRLLGQDARAFTINDGEWFPIYTNSNVDDPVLACGSRVAWILEADNSPWIVLATPDSQQLALELLSAVELDQQD